MKRSSSVVDNEYASQGGFIGDTLPQEFEGEDEFVDATTTDFFQRIESYKKDEGKQLAKGDGYLVKSYEKHGNDITFDGGQVVPVRIHIILCICFGVRSFIRI